MSKAIPFGGAFIQACDALGLNPESAMAMVVNTVPREVAENVKNCEDMMILIAAAFSGHITNGVKRNREQGVVPPAILIGTDVSDLYDAAAGRLQ